MKICVISSSIFAVGNGPSGLPGYGGLEVVAWECARGLANKGHKVTLIAPQGSWCPNVEVIPCLPPGMAEEAAYGGTVYKSPGGEDIRWPGYWPKLLEFNDGGVIIDHSWHKWSYMLQAERRLTAPIMGVCHAPIQTMYQALPPVENPCFVCISDDQRWHFEAYHAPRTARTCHNGFDVDHYKSIGTNRTNRFLFLARFSSIKGPDIALKACKEVGVGLDAIGDTSITGEPGYYEECKKLAQGWDANIIPGVSRGETVWWYSQAHCFLHPNMRFREPLGLAPLEAQACGLPVIAWDYGAMRETVVQGETGWLVRSEKEFTERVREASYGIPDVMRRRCRDWARTFDLDRMVNRYEELCHEALQSPW